ncbi:uncharacterized protein N7477_006330 [Penicillium maclennaniae]|uniref:uncharacterized protein n=1 Tax=Penicillium maclennaniae TaxID=1343394 RepID=UPI00253F652B|nr:uncharacterized protein N7477_006330 [Penicillium maclennaniae]KAJ5667760.1 hypothetical protein N7477_006330 [Penicillium maclennaniae]
MGYSEAYCHLCGVSFNIARRRKPGEPDLASWDYAGGQDDYPPVDEVEDLLECAKKGCCIAVKQPRDEPENDLAEDLDYVPQKDTEDELEYDSEHDSSDVMSLDDEQEDDDGDENMDDADSYQDFLARTVIPQKFRGEPVGNLAYSNNRNEIILSITSDDVPEGYDTTELEHIPGPTCEEARAYSGHAISLEEMRGCRTAQFLVHKDTSSEPWHPDGLHETWELSESYFLSGLCDGMASRDCSDQHVSPMRGGYGIVRADNINFDPEWTPANDIAMPFHPWCFDIFSRQSKAKFGKVNVSGLMRWRNSAFDYDDFHNFPRDGDVYEAREQSWRHYPGKEYLAANPLYVPDLPAFLMDFDGEKTEKVEYGIQSVQDTEYSPSPSQSCGSDILASLPLDIRLLLVDYLESVDITSLRMASKAFTKLPNGIWYRLVRMKMPWLWEAWGGSSHIPSPWTTMTANEVKVLYHERRRYSDLLGGEYTPVEGITDFLLPLPSTVPDQVKLSREKTDWHRLYTEIKRNWPKLKGLRNRKRIWEDVADIIQRIEESEGRQ